MLNRYFDLSVELSDMGVVLGMLAMMIVAAFLEYKIIHSTNFKVRTWCGCGLAVLFVPISLLVYRLFCQGAETVQECFARGFTAIVVMSVMSLMSAAVIFCLVRKDRNISEVEKMKLADM